MLTSLPEDSETEYNKTAFTQMFHPVQRSQTQQAANILQELLTSNQPAHLMNVGQAFIACLNHKT